MHFPATPDCVSLPVVVGAPLHSWLRAPGAVPRHSWLGSAGGGGVWPLATPGCGSWLRFPATPGLGPLAAVVCGCLPLLGAVLVAVPRHSWLGSAGRGGGRFRGVGWGVSRRVCVCGAARARLVSVLVCVTCVRGGGVGVGVSSVCVGVCVCVCACVVCGGWFPWLGLAAGLGVGVAGVYRGWSLATPGGGS